MRRFLPGTATVTGIRPTSVASGSAFIGHLHKVGHIVTDGHAAGEIGEHRPVSCVLIVLINDGPIGLFHRLVTFALGGVMGAEFVYRSFTPDCFSILRSVLIVVSFLGCGMVTRPGFLGCLNWW